VQRVCQSAANRPTGRPPSTASPPQDPKGRLPLDLAKASAGSGTPLGGGKPGAVAASAAALLKKVVDALQPTALIGAAAVGRAFDQGVIETLTRVGLGGLVVERERGGLATAVLGGKRGRGISSRT
jgi:hypothetical protein